MEERELLITNSDMPLVDVDITPQGHIAAVLRQGDHYRFEVDGASRPMRQDLRFPMVRMSDAGYVLLADTRTEREQHNATILDLKTSQGTTFRIGDAVQEIVTFQEYLAVAYFDEAFGSRDDLFGAVVFDLHGTLLWHDDSVVDCYCACAQDAGHFLYLCYPDFNLKQLDLQSFQLREWIIPSVLHGAAAMTATGDSLIFHSPSHNTDTLFRWRFGADTVERIGAYTAPLRGAADGRFITQGTMGFVELNFSNA